MSAQCAREQQICRGRTKRLSLSTVRGERIFDVGVASLHRLLAEMDRIRPCDSIEVVVGHIQREPTLIDEESDLSLYSLRSLRGTSYS